MRKHPDQLRADLQKTYSIDLDHAMTGEHTAAHIGALVSCLPSDSSMFRAESDDAAWTLETTLLAILHNDIAGLIWGMGDARKRGPKPKPIGPSWMTKPRMRTLESRVMTVDELMEELNKPRR